MQLVDVVQRQAKNTHTTQRHAPTAASSASRGASGSARSIEQVRSRMQGVNQQLGQVDLQLHEMDVMETTSLRRTVHPGANPESPTIRHILQSVAHPSPPRQDSFPVDAPALPISSAWAYNPQRDATVSEEPLRAIAPQLQHALPNRNLPMMSEEREDGAGRVAPPLYSALQGTVHPHPIHTTAPQETSLPRHHPLLGEDVFPRLSQQRGAMRRTLRQGGLRRCVRLTERRRRRRECHVK